MVCRAPTSSVTCAGSSSTGQHLSYDNEGRLTAWQNAPSSPTSTAQYLYDGEGNRVEQQTTSSGTTTTTTYVGDIEQVATSGSTTTTTTYYYAAGQRIALAVNGALSYLASDLLGSATVALNTSGTPTASQLYAPYGGVRYSNGTMPTDYGFTGQRADASTGLDYYGARYYDPTLGQFTSADTVLDGLNRYGYVGGNPISYTDPSGHMSDEREDHGGVQTAYGESTENIANPQGGTPETNSGNNGGDGAGGGGGGFPVWLVVLLIGAAGVVGYGAANTPTYYPPDVDQGELARALARTGPDTDYWNQRNAPKSTPAQSKPGKPGKPSGGGEETAPQPFAGSSGGAGGAPPIRGGAAGSEDDDCGCSEVWKRITATGSDMPWSGIPKTFDLQTEDGIYEIQSNATKHMEDFIRGRTGRQIPNRGPLRIGVSDPRLLGDIMLQSLVSAIDYVLPLLGPGDNAVTDGFWELGINGTNHHVYHANCRW